jgi:O-antigen ligase
VSVAAIAAFSVSLLLYAEILLFGGNATNLALGFSGAWLLMLALVLSQSWAQAALYTARVSWIGLLFGLVVLAGTLTLTPFALGGPHPVWTWVARGRATASVDPYLTVVELIKLASLAAAFLIGVVIGSDDERAASAIRWLLRVGLIFSLWAFVDRFLDPAKLLGGPRLSASLGSANTAAVFFGALTLLNLVDLDRQFQRHRPTGTRARGVDIHRLERLAPNIALPFVGLAAAATCLILTLSRGGLSATAAIAVVMMGAAGVARARRGALTGPTLAVVTILGGMVLASFALNLGSLQERLTFLHEDVANRDAVFAAHWTAFTAAPWSGYGLGSFAHINAMIMSQSNLAALGILGATHNVYLQWLEQAGLIGALPMFACVGMVALKIGRGAVRRSRMRSWLVGVLAVLVLFLIQGAADFGLEVPALATFLSLLLGLACGVAGGTAPLAQPVARAPRRLSRPRATPTGQVKGDPGTALASAHASQRGCVI